MTTPLVRGFWKNLISPFWEPLVLDMLRMWATRKHAHEIFQAKTNAYV